MQKVTITVSVISHGYDTIRMPHSELHLVQANSLESAVKALEIVLHASSKKWNSDFHCDEVLIKTIGAPFGTDEKTDRHVRELVINLQSKSVGTIPKELL